MNYGAIQINIVNIFGLRLYDLTNINDDQILMSDIDEPYDFIT